MRNALQDGKQTSVGQRCLTFLLTAMLVVAADQASKALVRASAAAGGRIGTLIPGVIDLVRVENTGAAFSVGEGAGALFVAIALVVVAGAFVLTLREPLPLPLVVSIACVAGGGVGNLIDRLAHGSVTDFLATVWISFPVFNVADIFVTCGVVISCIGYLRWSAHVEVS